MQNDQISGNLYWFVCMSGHSALNLDTKEVPIIKRKTITKAKLLGVKPSILKYTPVQYGFLRVAGIPFYSEHKVCLKSLRKG